MSETTTTTNTTETDLTDTAADDPTIFDAAGDGLPEKDADGKAVMPEWLPGDQFWDKDKGEIRIEALAKSWKDMRGQVSQKSKGGSAPPEKPDDYQLPKVEGVPDGLIGGEKDTLWPEVKAAAHKAGISQQQLTEIATPYLRQVAASLATQQEKDDPAARKTRLVAAYREEIGKLGPDGEAMVRDVKGWMTGLETRGVLTADERADLAHGAGTANGLRALAKLREMTGDKPVPVQGLNSEGGSKADAERMLRQGYANGDDALVEKGNRLLLNLIKSGKLPQHAT